MAATNVKSAVKKLQMDIARFRHDQGVSGTLAVVKLLIVVDFWPVLYHRLCEHSRERQNVIRRALRLLLMLLKPLVEGISGARIDPEASIGGGFLLHQSSGVVIAPGAVIGENCTFFSGACVLHDSGDDSFAAPKVGDDVRLTVGSKVIGNVTIGDRVTVGANAVVMNDVRDGAVVVGIPAQPLMPRKQAINE